MGKVEQLLEEYRKSAEDRKVSERKLSEGKSWVLSQDWDANLERFARFVGYFPLFEPFEDLIKVEKLKEPDLRLHRNIPEEHRVEVVFSWTLKTLTLPTQEGTISSRKVARVRNQIRITWAQTPLGNSVIAIEGAKQEEIVGIVTNTPEYQERIAGAVVRSYLNPNVETVLYGAPHLVKIDEL